MTDTFDRIAFTARADQLHALYIDEVRPDYERRAELKAEGVHCIPASITDKDQENLCFLTRDVAEFVECAFGREVPASVVLHGVAELLRWFTQSCHGDEDL